jgi:hypothetical protein
MKWPASRGQLISTGVADLEELGAAARRVGEQRLDLAAARRVDDVDGHVAHVEELGDRAAEVRCPAAAAAGADADLLGAQRDGAGRPAASVDAAATRTGPRPATSTVTMPPSLPRPVPDSRLQWPMKSATKRRRGSRRSATARPPAPRGRVHHGDPVRQRERLGLVVRHVDERDADLLLQVDELDLHVLAQLRVERGERLVEQQHRRVRDQRPRDGDALLLAAGELVRIALAEAARRTSASASATSAAISRAASSPS